MKLNKKQVDIFNNKLKNTMIDFYINDNNELVSIELNDWWGHSWIYFDECDLERIKNTKLKDELLDRFDEEYLADELNTLMGCSIAGKPSNTELIETYTDFVKELPQVRKIIERL